jgi:hypothetical protein
MDAAYAKAMQRIEDRYSGKNVLGRKRIDQRLEFIRKEVENDNKDRIHRGR